jgi:glycosyltransferase involved in cell wall biosynthesis
MTTGRRLSLVLPCYNEELIIEETVGRCLAALRSFTDGYEIVIVDDGSTDGSLEIADRIRHECTAVRVTRNPINLGVGTSLLIGMRAAIGDLVLHNGMDYPFDLNDLKFILPLFPEWDVVVVARTDRSAHSPYRRLTSWINYRLIRLLFRIKLDDLNFVQVYKREVCRTITVRAKSPAFVTPELLIRARDHGFKITEVRATFHPRKKGTPNYGKPRDILWALADMLSFWLERWTPEYRRASLARVESAGGQRA